MTEDSHSGATSEEQAKAESRFDAALDEKALPAIDLSTFFLSLSHSVLVHLGDAPSPDGGPSTLSLPMARQTIDLLGLLQEKTRGNLTGAEEQMLSQVLYELRTRFLEVQKSGSK